MIAKPPSRLVLTRPLVWFDTETTGLSAEFDRVIQIGVVKCVPDDTAKEWQTLINPGEPIPPEMTEIHGITDEMVKDAPTFQKLAGNLFTAFQGCDLAGNNVPFDMRMIRAEFKRAGLLTRDVFEGARIVDAQRVFHHFHRRRLIDAVRIYLGDEIADKFEEEAHDALVDAHMSMLVFEKMMNVHQDLPRTVEDLDQMFFWTPKPTDVTACGKFIWRFGEATFNFGKYGSRRKTLRDVSKEDPGYLRWLINQDFSDDIKEIARMALEGKYPVRKVPA